MVSRIPGRFAPYSIASPTKDRVRLAWLWDRLPEPERHIRTIGCFEPVAVCVVVMTGYLGGVLSTGFFEDPLSAVGIIWLMIGELTGVFIGASAARMLPQ